MKAFPVANLESDYYFTKKAYLDENYILLTPETPVSAKLINRLKRWNYRDILSNGVPVDTPTVKEVPVPEGTSLSIDQDVREQGMLDEVRGFYAELTTFIERTFTNFVTRNELAEGPVSDIVKRTIDMVRSHRQYILRVDVLSASGKNYIVNHSAKTAILAVAIGMVIRMPSHKLIELGTAAVLHEIGMIRLPAQLYMSNKQLTEQERRAITAHTVLGFKILRQFSFAMAVSLAVLECKEHLDGSGYPRGLTAERISLYAKVIMVASSYAAQTSIRPYRMSVDGHAALLDMLQRKGTIYDDTILRALVTQLSLYPLGTYVRLANDTRGMVVDTNPDAPRHPKVRVIAGPTGEPYAQQQVVDTDSAEEFHIVEAISADQVKERGAAPS